MQTPLKASSSSAGALLSSSTFEVPQFQREYSWQDDDVADLWNDLRNSIDSESYFLGLIILTEEGSSKHVVDGQQRIITISLLATAIYFAAIEFGRKALADRIQADFLRSIDYESDETHPRVTLSDIADNAMFQKILDRGTVPMNPDGDGSVSHRIARSYRYLAEKLRDDLKTDPFKRLGKWTDFLTNRVYFAVFVHPDSSSAYQVYEVINTRGKELTTADLLKNYILSQTNNQRRQERYHEWKSISKQFSPDEANTFVQYIRHVITVRNGHILPKDLFGFLANRVQYTGKHPPAVDELMRLLETNLPLYLQMIDPTLAGPAEPEALRVFSALNSLGVIAVRPILLAVANVPGSLDGMKYILRLVVRRIVVGNLGTGNVERRLGEAARKVHESQSWKVLSDDLKDLNPTREDFVAQIARRSFNKAVLSFLRRSIIDRNITPDLKGVLHFIWTQQASASWKGIGEEDGAFWASTIGNTFLATLDRRPKGVIDWVGFKREFLPHAVQSEWKSELESVSEWDAAAIESMGKRLAKVAGEVWYEES